jgi:hypothetical protein
VPEGVLGRDDIIEGLDAVAALLAQDDVHGVLVVVGGSYLALHGLRDTTADVDTITKIDEAIRRAVETVSAQLDFRVNWLNDKAVAHAPVGLSEDMCEPLYEHPNLVLLGPPPDFVFLMKLNAARAPDFDDMVALWPRCTFETAQQAAEQFRIAYPAALDDPDLAEFIEQIARIASPG